MASILNIVLLLPTVIYNLLIFLPKNVLMRLSVILKYCLGPGFPMIHVFIVYDWRLKIQRKQSYKMSQTNLWRKVI